MLNDPFAGSRIKGAPIRNDQLCQSESLSILLGSDKYLHFLNVNPGRLIVVAFVRFANISYVIKTIYELVISCSHITGDGYHERLGSVVTSPGTFSTLMRTAFIDPSVFRVELIVP